MSKVSAFIILGPLLLAQQEITIENMLNMLKGSEFSTHLVQPVPEKSSLDAEYNETIRRLNEITFGGSSTVERLVALKRLRETPMPTQKVEFIVGKCQAAFDRKPVDWETIRRCFVVAQEGCTDQRLGLIAKAIVSFEAGDMTDVSVEQLRTTMAIFTSIAQLKFPGAAEILEQAAGGSLWDGKTIRSSARPDILRLLQGRAVLCISALPMETAEEILGRLEGQFPPSQFANNGPDARIALFVAVLREDLKLQHEGKPPLIEGIR